MARKAPAPLDLHELRVSKGFSQDDIGNRRDVGDIEKGLKMPGVKLTNRMAKALNITTEQLIAACVESRQRYLNPKMHHTKRKRHADQQQGQNQQPPPPPPHKEQG